VLLFLAPFLLGLLIFTIYPLVASAILSFTDFQAGSKKPVNFVGFANYVNLFTGAASPRFFTGIENTLWMVIVLVPVQTIWALLLATLINRFKRTAKVYRTIFYLPTMVPVVAAALGFLVMLAPNSALDGLFHMVGVPMPAWFYDPVWAKPSLVGLRMWMIGNTMVIFSAALLDVPVHLYEAAELDGAGPVRRFLSITLPSIAPVLYFSVLTGMIYTFQYFSEAYVISSSANPAESATQLIGFPQDSLFFYSSNIYLQGFGYFKTGVASAMAWILSLVIFAITVVFIRASRRTIYYAGDEG
jgi:multiple sugar transport system permease protein